MRTRILVAAIVAAGSIFGQGTISSLSPASATAGGAAFTLTVTGSGFAASNLVQWNGANIPTTFVSTLQLNASVSAALIATNGTASIRVKLSALQNQFSNLVSYTINNPAPSVVNYGPGSTPIATTPTLTVNGTGFATNSVVRLNGNNLATTFVSATQLTAVVSLPFTATAATFTMSVFSPAPGGGTFTAGLFLVTNPVPNLTSIGPTSALAGSPDLTLSVNGTFFVSTSVVKLDGSPLVTTFTGSSHLTATIPAASMTTAGQRAITVTSPSPGGGTSASSMTFTVNNPAPVFSALSPGVIAVGDPNTTLSVQGTGFLSGCVVEVVGISPLATTFLSPTLVNAVLPASIIANPGLVDIRVTNPAPTVGPSGVVQLELFNAVPSVTSAVSQTPPIVSNETETLMIGGTGFHQHSVVRLDGISLPTFFVGTVTATNALVASVPANLVAPGTRQITVFNPGSGGGESAQFPIVFDAPAPIIVSTSPSGATAGQGDTTIHVFGSNFFPSSTVAAGDHPLATTLVSPNQIDGFIPAALMRAIRVWDIRVVTPLPGGGIASMPLPVGGPVILGVSPAVIPVLAPASPPVTITVTGGPFGGFDQIRINGLARPTSVVNGNTVECTVDGTVAALLQPGGVAVTVTRPGGPDLGLSNAVGVPVANGVVPDNSGTVTLASAPPAPGAQFDIRVEAPVGATAVTLIADTASPPPQVLALAPGFDLAIGPGLGAPTMLADGMGIFGPPTATTTKVDDLSSVGVPGPRSVYEVFGIVAPPVVVGVTFSMAAVYATGASPVGLQVTHVSGPYTL